MPVSQKPSFLGWWDSDPESEVRIRIEVNIAKPVVENDPRKKFKNEGNHTYYVDANFDCMCPQDFLFQDKSIIVVFVLSGNNTRDKY